MSQADTIVWLQSRNALPKRITVLQPDNYTRDIPENTIVLLIAPSDFYASAQQAGKGSDYRPMEWPAIPTEVKPPQPSLVSCRYLDDDLAARVIVRVMKGIDRLIAEKRAEVERSAKPVDITAQITASITNCLKDLQSQLSVKDLPQLQLPVFRLEEDKAITQQLNAFGETSKKMNGELEKLREATQHW